MNRVKLAGSAIGTLAIVGLAVGHASAGPYSDEKQNVRECVDRLHVDRKDMSEANVVAGCGCLAGIFIVRKALRDQLGNESSNELAKSILGGVSLAGINCIGAFSAKDAGEF